jgi:DNA mismatch repair protein MutS
MKKLHNNWNILNENIAYLIGVLYGDGNVMPNLIRIAVKDKDFILNVKNCLELISKENLQIKKIKNENGFGKKGSFLFQIKFNSILLKPIIEKHYENILNQNDKVISAFLNGCFDSEGSVDKDRLRVRLSVRNIIYAKKISEGLTKLGVIHSFTEIKNRGVQFFSVKIYDRNCIDFNHFIKFSIKRKKERLQKEIWKLLNADKYFEDKQLETLKLPEKEWCKKHQLTRNQYYRHKRLLTANS